MIAPARRVTTATWRGRWSDGARCIPAEVPVAFSYNRLTHAVMMATPDDLEDFALGFSRSEGIVSRADEVEELALVPTAAGVECRMWISPDRLDRLEQRRRLLAGPTGCGLCGLESLAEAVRTPPAVGAGIAVDAAQVQAAVAALAPLQRLNGETRAVHAAGFWRPGDGMVAVREDVGRHNALDKLSGALFRDGAEASTGLLVMTSRISVELVQKAAAAGAALLVAVSAPTQLALQVAEAAGLTLIGVARGDGFEVFTHPHRVSGAVAAR